VSQLTTHSGSPVYGDQSEIYDDPSTAESGYNGHMSLETGPWMLWLIF